jgi:hypothetical protein
MPKNKGAKNNVVPFVKVIWFDGPCPFLTCLKTTRHSHPVCPKCDTVRYANIFNCDECRANRGKEDAEYLKDVAKTTLGVQI